VIKTLGVGAWNSRKPDEREPYQRSLVLTLVSLAWGVWIEAAEPSWRQALVLAAAGLPTWALERWIANWVLPGVGARAGLTAAKTDARRAARTSIRSPRPHRDRSRTSHVRRLDGDLRRPRNLGKRLSGRLTISRKVRRRVLAA
jgi:hypothetical protein